MTVVEAEQRFAERTRTSHVRRWLLAGGAVVVLALAVYVVWFSPLLVVREVRVVGAVTVSADSVRQAAAVPDRVPLARADVAGIAARVGALPRVASVEVRRGWPDVLVLVVTERTPMAVVPLGGAFTYVDSTGARFGQVSVPPPGMVVVRPRDDDALSSALGVVQALPTDLRATVVSVAARTRDDVLLTLTSGAVVQWGSADRSDRKVVVLRSLLALHARRYDVSAPDLPTTLGTLPSPSASSGR